VNLGIITRFGKWSVVESQHKLAPYNMEQQKAPKWNEPGYWKYWYWNRGGRDKVQATRKVAEYKRYLREKGE